MRMRSTPSLSTALWLAENLPLYFKKYLKMPMRYFLLIIYLYFSPAGMLDDSFSEMKEKDLKKRKIDLYLHYSNYYEYLLRNALF